MDTNKPESEAGFPQWLRPGGLLGVFALIFIFLLAFTYELTRERIAIQDQLRLETQLKQLLIPGTYNNEPAIDIFRPSDSERIVYRARMNNSPVAALIKTVAKDGYSGSIQLLVGIKTSGELLGVRALEHRETPGLGDDINLSRSDWILGFNNRSLNDPSPEGWAVKKDGGVFDAFTGATITPRAVIGEIKKTLIYFRDHQQELFK
jgi:electron transport complex protein RnfG